MDELSSLMGWLKGEKEVMGPRAILLNFITSLISFTTHHVHTYDLPYLTYYLHLNHLVSVPCARYTRCTDYQLLRKQFTPRHRLASPS